MPALRCTYRLVLALGVTILWFVPALAVRVGGERAWALRAGAGIQRRWARAMLWATGVELDVPDAPPVGRFVVASNHVSYLDIPVFSAVFGGRFVAKSEIARWPLFGVLSRSVQTIFVERSRRRDVVRVAGEMGRSLESGVTVVLFPEARSGSGREVGRYHSPLFEAAVEAGVPCLPAAVSYATPGSEWSPSWTVAWWGGLRLWPHALRLLSLPSVRARVRWDEAPVAGADRKELARRCHAATVRLHLPHPAGDPPPAVRRELAEAASTAAAAVTED